MKTFTKALGFRFALIIISILIMFPVMWAWNYAIAAIFELPTINWLQAWCLAFYLMYFLNQLKLNQLKLNNKE